MRLLTVLATGAVFTITLGSVGPRDYQEDELARQVISMMESASEIELPEKLPDHLRDTVPDRGTREYEEYTRFIAGEAFFAPELVETLDEDLFHRVAEFWALPPARQVRIIPSLGEYYVEAGETLRRMILRLIRELSQRATQVEHSEFWIEPALLSILENADDKAHIVMALKELPGIRISDAGYLSLVEMSKSWQERDEEIRVELVRTIAQGRNDNRPPLSVCRYLLEVAKFDKSQQCRLAAINDWQATYLGRETVAPVYLKLFDASLDSGDWALARKVMHVLGTQSRVVEALDHFVAALDVRDLLTRAAAINAMDNILGIQRDRIPRDVRVYELDYEKPDVSMELIARLDGAVRRWKRWWETSGAEILRSGGPNQLKESAQSLYQGS